MRCKKANSPVALIFAPEFPTGYTNLFVKLKTNPLDSINLATCDGDFNFFTTIAGSHSFYPKPFMYLGLAPITGGQNLTIRYWLALKPGIK